MTHSNSEKEPKIKQIGAKTQIIFTMKSFLTTIGTILTLFFGFYQLVVVPKVNATEEQYVKMFDDQKEQNRIFYEKLGNINSSIGSLNATIEALNKENTIRHNISNTGGSFGHVVPNNKNFIPNNTFASN